MSKILIIGAGPGLAFTVAQRFGREGWRVVLASRNEERLKDEVKALQAEGAEATYHRCDVTDFDAVDRIVREESGNGGIDLLNYNAAVIRPSTPLLDTSIDDRRSDLAAGDAAAHSPAGRINIRWPVLILGVAPHDIPSRVLFSASMTREEAHEQACARRGCIGHRRRRLRCLPVVWNAPIWRRIEGPPSKRQQ
jgi:hypothetical protein